MKGVLDTSVVIAEEPPRFEPEEDLFVSAVTFAELHFAVLTASADSVRASRLRRLAKLTELFDPLPVDADVAAAYGQLAAAITAAGRSPRPRAMDLLIAATAVANGARLHTRNAADLKGLGELVEIVTAD